MKCPVYKMKPCVKKECAWWTELTMKNIQTQQIEVMGNCAIAWLPEMLREQNHNTLGVQAAVETRGNETVKRQDVLNNLFSGMAQIAIQERKRLA